jgi:hypothetical protein
MDILDEYRRVIRLLDRRVKQRLRHLASDYHEQIRAFEDTEDLYRIALTAVGSAFSVRLKQEAEILAFALIAMEAAADGMHRVPAARAGTMSEASDLLSLELQMQMQRRSHCLSTLASILGKVSDTQDAIIQNIK